MQPSGKSDRIHESERPRLLASALPAELRRTPEAESLVNEIRSAVERFQKAITTGDKQCIREAHITAKAMDNSANYEQLLWDYERLKPWFPQPSQIDPNKIAPELHLVTPGSREERLFRVCRGFWSMPYSKGYGRRLRYVVFDAYHNAVIGIIGLHSAAADLACRDQYLGFKKGQSGKLAVINSTLDAYTLGATPPYAALLGGKLIAGLTATETIRRDYWRTYGSKKTLLRDERLAQPLVAVTTASAYGRSSIYNRLAYQGRPLAKPIGYTKGFGTIHLEAIYPRIEDWLKTVNLYVPPGFGNGPKVRWQNVSRALLALDLPRSFLKHGLLREVFILEHVSNLRQVCVEGAIPQPVAFDAANWASYWKERWALPRSHRDPTWREIDTDETIRAGLTNGLPSV